MSLEVSTLKFSLLPAQEDTGMVLTTKSVRRSAKFCWRKNLNKESDNREKPLSTFAGQIACKIHIERHGI